MALDHALAMAGPWLDDWAGPGTLETPSSRMPQDHFFNRFTPNADGFAHLYFQLGTDLFPQKNLKPVSTKKKPKAGVKEAPHESIFIPKVKKNL